MSLQADELELSYLIRNVRENLLGVIRQLETAHLDNFKYDRWLVQCIIYLIGYMV